MKNTLLEIFSILNKVNTLTNKLKKDDFKYESITDHLDCHSINLKDTASFLDSYVQHLNTFSGSETKDLQKELSETLNKVNLALNKEQKISNKINNHNKTIHMEINDLYSKLNDIYENHKIYEYSFSINNLNQQTINLFKSILNDMDICFVVKYGYSIRFYHTEYLIDYFIEKLGDRNLKGRFGIQSDNFDIDVLKKIIN